MKRNRTSKNGETKEYISIQSTVNVTVSSQAEKRVGYIDKFMSKADFTARNGKQVQGRRIKIIRIKTATFQIVRH